MQATRERRNGRRSRRCCRRRVAWGGRASAICTRSSTLFSICSATGSQWRYLPQEFRRVRPCKAISTAGATMAHGPGSTLVSWRALGERSGVERPRRPASSTARVCRPAESGGPRGVDAGRRIKRRKHHIITDTQGFLLAVRVPADIQARTARFPCCARCGVPFPICAMSSPTASIAVRNRSARSPIAALGRSKSSSTCPVSKASNCCRDAGSSSAPLPGSAALGVSPRTSRLPSTAPQPGCSWPTCGSSPAVSQQPDPSNASV